MSRLTDDQTRAVAQAIADELMRQEGSIDPPYPALPDDMELNYIDQRRVDMGAVARAAIAAALAEDSEDAEQSHQEGYDEGYREGQSDAAGAQSDFWRMMLRYFDKHGIEPASDDGEGYSAHQMMDALHEHESEVDAAHQAEIERLHSALTDLVSWVPERPTSPVWQLEAGVHGADDAIAAARKALGRDAT